MSGSFLGLDVGVWSAVAASTTALGTVVLAIVTGVYVKKTSRLVRATQESAVAVTESLRVQRLMAIIGSSPVILVTRDIRAGKLKLFVRNIGVAEAQDVNVTAYLDGEALGDPQQLTTIQQGARPRTVTVTVTGPQARTIKSRSVPLRIRSEFTGPTGQQLITEREYRLDGTQETQLLNGSGTVLSTDFGLD